MPDFYYDLHIHSALSPCGDADMTPNNIVNMALVAGVQLLALTDHNSCKNCPAVLQLAGQAGIAAIPGMELCTREEIHVVCLFGSLAAAMEFDEYLYHFLPDIPNRPEIFGQQQIFDANDRCIGIEPRLLLSATTLSIDQLPALMQRFGGVCFPAHVDKASYSMLASFGFIPADTPFRAVEVFEPDRFHPPEVILPGRLRRVSNSDAHYLWQIGSRQQLLSAPRPDFAAVCQLLGYPPAGG